MPSGPDLLTETLQSKLSRRESSPDFDLHGGVQQVLHDVGMVTADCGGKLSFFGRDPIIPSSLQSRRRMQTKGAYHRPVRRQRAS
jgi:hypothetical protein